MHDITIADADAELRRVVLVGQGGFESVSSPWVPYCPAMNQTFTALPARRLAPLDRAMHFLPVVKDVPRGDASVRSVPA
jgi:hypothetical protein